MPRSALHLLAAVVLAGTSAFGADQLLTGKKLLIKNPPSGTASNKVVHLAKDANVALGATGSAGDPQCTGAGGGGGSLRIIASGGAGDVTIPLPCGGWTTNGANTLYKYKDASGGSCKLVLVKAGVLAKAVCKGSQVAIDLNGTMSPVAVVTTLNTEAYCTEFGGTAVQDGSDDKTFLRKESVAPAGCPTITSTTSSTSSTSSSTVPCGSPGQPCCGTACTGGCCASGVCVAEGAACGAPVCSDTSGCAFDDACDETGTKTQSCTQATCTAGTCLDGAPVPTVVGCTRTTDGDLCGAQSCGGGNIRDLCCSAADNTCTVLCSTCYCATCSVTGP